MVERKEDSEQRGPLVLESQGVLLDNGICFKYDYSSLGKSLCIIKMPEEIIVKNLVNLTSLGTNQLHFVPVMFLVVCYYFIISLTFSGAALNVMLVTFSLTSVNMLMFIYALE